MKTRRFRVLRHLRCLKVRRRARVAFLERLEDRLLQATITVNTASDTGSGTTLTLRQAIEVSNGTLLVSSLTAQQQLLVSGPLGSPNTIDFNISASPAVIQPNGSSLPSITAPVTIDGTSEPGYANTPIVVIDGSQAGNLADGLEVDSGGSGSTIQGLDIVNFDSGVPVYATGSGADGIYINGASVTVTGNYVGVDASGTTAEANGNGISIFGLTAGSDTAAISGNLISGNMVYGVFLAPSTLLNTVITGNLIGTDKTGNVGLGSQNGVFSNASGTVTIGGTTAAAQNVISGNGGGGISVGGGGGVISPVLIEGNRIGTNAEGTAALGNGSGKDGITITGASDVSVGGTASGAGNLISGNSGNGISVLGATVNFIAGNQIGTDLIEGNQIGTDLTGTGSLGNGGNGVAMGSSSDVTIGGTASGEGHLISGNLGDGISIASFGSIPSTGNVIEGNQIGTNLAGTASVGNGGDGVAIGTATSDPGGDSGNVIGGVAPGAGNTIAFNVTSQ